MNMDSKDQHLLFRIIKESDAEELYTFFQEADTTFKKFFHPHPFDMETLRQICTSKKDHYFVMTLHQKIIGYAMLRLFGYDIPSFGCCIRTGYEGRGFGYLLTVWTIDQAKKLGYKKIILKTYKKNLPAITIYKKAGFKIVGETEDKKQHKMELDLSSSSNKEHL